MVESLGDAVSNVLGTVISGYVALFGISAVSCICCCLCCVILIVILLSVKHDES